jgi:hypothetical protein
MKKIILLLAVALLASCGPRMQHPKEKQNELVEYLLKYKEARYNTGNSIQMDELWQEREDGLVLLQDSLGIFHNVKGRIEQIRANNIGNSKVLEFEIQIEPQEYFKIDLDCKYIIPQDSVKNDSLYNLIKSLSNYTTVFVDGAIAITSKLKPDNSSISEKDLQLSYPDYNFNVVSLSTSELPDISSNLRNAIIIWRKSFECILKNGKSAETDDNIEAFKKAKQVLTPAENVYLSKYINVCSIDLYRD